MNVEQIELYDGTKLTTISLGSMMREQGNKLAAKFNGSTFMNFQITIAAAGGQCEISAQTNYDAEKDEILGMFLFVMASECAR